MEQAMTHHELWQSLADVERKYILATVAHCSGNRTRAAKVLKISIRGLRMKLHNYAAESDPELPRKVGEGFEESQVRSL